MEAGWSNAEGTREDGGQGDIRAKSRKSSRQRDGTKLKKDGTNTPKMNQAPEYQRKGREPQTKQRVTDMSETKDGERERASRARV